MSNWLLDAEVTVSMAEAISWPWFLTMVHLKIISGEPLCRATPTR